MKWPAGTLSCEICHCYVLPGRREYQLYYCENCKNTLYICRQCHDDRCCPECGSRRVNSVFERLLQFGRRGMVTVGQVSAEREDTHVLAV